MALLPPPIDIKIDDFDTLENLINYIYDEHFKPNFMNKQQRPTLFGKFIYLDLNFINYKPERFWHIISFKADEERYTVNPCINSEDKLFCKKKKTTCDSSLFIPQDQRLADRSECIYRMRRLNLICPIISLANQKNEHITMWSEEVSTDDLKIIRKVYIRYQDDILDYLIVLVDGEIIGKNNYKFVTAYPVVHNGTKKRLDISYANSK